MNSEKSPANSGQTRQWYTELNPVRPFIVMVLFLALWGGLRVILHTLAFSEDLRVFWRTCAVVFPGWIALSLLSVIAWGGPAKKRLCSWVVSLWRNARRSPLRMASLIVLPTGLLALHISIIICASLAFCAPDNWTAFLLPLFLFTAAALILVCASLCAWGDRARRYLSRQLGCFVGGIRRKPLRGLLVLLLVIGSAWSVWLGAISLLLIQPWFFAFVGLTIPGVGVVLLALWLWRASRRVCARYLLWLLLLATIYSISFEFWEWFFPTPVMGGVYQRPMWRTTEQPDDSAQETPDGHSNDVQD